MKTIKGHNMSEDLKSFNLKAPMSIHTQLQELAREKKYLLHHCILRVQKN